MEFLILSILFVFFLANFVFSFWPLVRFSTTFIEVNSSSEKKQRISRLMSEREILYKNILEVRFDKAMKKLSEDDYSKLLRPLNEKALNVLRRLEALGVKEGDPILGKNDVTQNTSEREDIKGKIEKEILQYRKSNVISIDKDSSKEDAKNEKNSLKIQSLFCTSCGHLRRDEDKFCSRCGSEIT